MSVTVEQLLATALALPEAERLRLAEALFAASAPPVPEPTGEAWVTELQRRSLEIDEKRALLTPWEEVKRRARDGSGNG